MPFVIKSDLLFMSILITYATYSHIVLAIEYQFLCNVLMANLVPELSSILVMRTKFKRME